MAFIEPPLFSALNDEAKHYLDDNGFVAFASQFSSGSITAMRAKLIELAEKEVELGVGCLYENLPSQHGNIINPDSRCQRIWNILNKSELFHIMPLSSIHKDAMTHIFKRPTQHELYKISSFQANILKPGATQQKIHIDSPLPDPQPCWQVKANTITLLDAFTQFNGGTMVVPGSHKYLRKPTGTSHELGQLVSIIAPVGTTIVTLGGLWHASGSNKSENSRVVVLGSYCASYCIDIAFEEIHPIIDNHNIAFDQALRSMLSLDRPLKEGSVAF